MSDTNALKRLIETLAEERDLDLRGYKLSTLERRIRRRMTIVGVDNFDRYAELIRKTPGETNELLNTVLINVTEFFRDAQAWDILRAVVLPEMLGGMHPGDSIRAWSAGCATGEEPYSLAILLAEYFGERLKDYDIKIYATDIDQDALDIARKGEYAAERLHLVRAEWRARYFTGTSRVRLNRDLRRMVIFGCSNVVADAPISHCNLVICRNVLIYFDSGAQKQVFSRLHYALEPGGFLFLGKAESKLSGSPVFRSVNSRWRIFQRVDKEAMRVDVPAPSLTRSDDAVQEELHLLRNQYRLLLDTLNTGVIALDISDTVTACNDPALNVWGLSGPPVIGKRIQDTDLVRRCADLLPRIEQSRNTRDVVSFQCRIQNGGEERTVAVIIRPTFSETQHQRTGSIICIEDITAREKLQGAVLKLETAGEELKSLNEALESSNQALQSTNEELETTNEELQSLNEELETSNEELQSSNEELETTNEELQSLNEELENMNDELEIRTRDLDSVMEQYKKTVRRMPWPVVLVDGEEKIQLWNTAAQKLFGVGATTVTGVSVAQLPIQAALRKLVLRHLRTAMETRKSCTVRNHRLNTEDFAGAFDIEFSPIARDGKTVEGVLLTFGPIQNARNKGRAKNGARPNGSRGSTSK